MRSKISIDDALIALDRNGVAGSQKLAVRQTVNRAGHVHNCTHIVLDDEERDPQFEVGAFETIDKAVDERWIDVQDIARLGLLRTFQTTRICHLAAPSGP
jgi:hypothetical protein